jgi:hypothetical protein
MELKLRYVAKDDEGNINIKVFTIREIELGNPVYWLTALPGKNVKIISRDMFTDGQDMDGDDIYENDIWERNGFIGMVTFKYSQWIIEKVTSSKFLEYPAFNSNADTGKVIGNKWQNPELSEDKT